MADLKTAFISGGASGIGIFIARLCAARGMEIMLADRDIGKLAEAAATLPGGAAMIAMDVGQPAEWDRAVAAADAALGPVDLLVNSAGIRPNMTALLDTDIVAFNGMIATNLAGIFYGVRGFGPAMRARAAGHIVNVASQAGLIPLPTIGDYVAAKFGVVGLSEVLRQEPADSGVGVTVVISGLTATAMTSGKGMAAEAVAEAAMAPVDANRLYAITHPECREEITRRHAGIVAALDEADNRAAARP